MKEVFLRTAVSAALIGTLLIVPEAAGLHLVQFVPKMATKLGLPPPQSHDVAEISHSDEALALAVNQLLESHRRQSAYLERLAALAPKSQINELRYSTKRSSSPKKAAKSSPRSPMPAPETPAVMRSSNQRPVPVLPKENVHSPATKTSPRSPTPTPEPPPVIRSSNQRPLPVLPKENVHTPEKKPIHTETTTKKAIVVKEVADKEPVPQSNPVTAKPPVDNSDPSVRPPKLPPPSCSFHHFLHVVNPNSLSLHPLQRVAIGPFTLTSEDLQRAYSPRSQLLGKDGYPAKALSRVYPSSQPGFPINQNLVDAIPVKNGLPQKILNERWPTSSRLTSSADNTYSS